MVVHWVVVHWVKWAVDFLRQDVEVYDASCHTFDNCIEMDTA